LTVLRSGSATDVGRVRSMNEDLAFEGATLFAVADGMGGHAGGEVAARTAIESLRTGFDHAPSAEGLVEAVHEANHAVWDQGHSDPSLRGMGTTLIAAALVGTDEGDRLVVANVGDSRGYRLHQHELGQLTVDHSVAEELVARGELSEGEAAVHPQRHILTRALGVDPEVDVDVWQLVPEEGDRFLLCSDGLSNEVAAEEITRVLNEMHDPRQAAEKLVSLANERGGSDNITAVVLDVLVGATGTDGAEPPGEGSGNTALALLSAGSAGPGGAANEVALLSRLDQTTATPAVEKPEKPPEEQKPERKARRPRRITVRVVLFFLILGGIGYGVYRLVDWYVDSSYYVAFDNSHVTIFEGRKGGFVGIQPKVVRTSDITSSQLTSTLAGEISSGVEEPSLHDANVYVTNLREELCSETPPPKGLKCPPTSLSQISRFEPAPGFTPGARFESALWPGSHPVRGVM
jgi:PPM family protein phosphatase